MAPNATDIPIGHSDTVTITVTNEVKKIPKQQQENVKKFEQNNRLIIFQSILNSLAHVLIGFTVGSVLLYAFRNGLPLGATPLHIVLCVTGYHFLMAQAILSMSSDNGWSSKLKFVDKRRAHWILQVTGSSLAIAGTFVKIIDTNNHWNSLHGQFGLVALVFTTVSLVNGLSSLWAYELRGIFNGNISKITHICFGIVAFVAATICLSTGINKTMFKNWATVPFAYLLITFTVLFTFIIIINPTISFLNKSKNFVKK